MVPPDPHPGPTFQADPPVTPPTTPTVVAVDPPLVKASTNLLQLYSVRTVAWNCVVVWTAILVGMFMFDVYRVLREMTVETGAVIQGWFGPFTAVMAWYGASQVASPVTSTLVSGCSSTMLGESVCAASKGTIVSAISGASSAVAWKYTDVFTRMALKTVLAMMR